MHKIVRRSFINKLLSIPFGLAIFPLNLWAKKTCATGSDITGPYYRKGAPTRGDLAKEYDGNGILLTVKGTVYASDCNKPLQNAILDIWHASPEGKYDNNSKSFLFRGITKTDTRGNYKFRTMFPGYYAGRPRHIHLKVRHHNYGQLTTQLYFKGDEKLNSDHTVKVNRGKERAMLFVGTKEIGYESHFNIYLNN